MTNENYKDSFRKPEKLLEFAGLEEDHKVLDVCTGFGYLARHISMKTKKPVDAQNGSEMMGFLESFGMQSIVMEMEERYGIRHVFAPMEDPALSQVGVYDLITMQNCFNDLYNMPINRRKFFRSIRRALKPGGRFLLVADHGTSKSMHSIDEAVARGELAANGFVVIKSSDMFRSHADDRATSAWTDPNRADRFVLLCEEAI
jgi:predicted methyltransferase